MIIDSEKTFKIIGRTLGHVDKRLLDHGQRVAYIVQKMLEEDGRYTPREIRNIAFVTVLHDIGAYKTEEIDDMLEFETSDIWNHSVYGYLFVKYLSPFGTLASAILYHHLNYDKLKTLDVPNGELAQIMCLADRIDVGFHNNLGGKVVDELDASIGTRFSPYAVELFKKTNVKYNILNVLEKDDYTGELERILREVPFKERELDEFLKMLIFTIDFRSEYTVTHTIITTSIAVELARRFKLDSRLCKKIRYGALLHDLGKIGIPIEILEFPGKLSHQAMEQMKTHVLLTREIMAGDIDDETAEIALRHHEKLNGSGYPEGLTADDLTLPQRIVAVADIVSALSGTRSYKEAFDKEKILGIISHMRDEGQLDTQVVNMVNDNFDSIMQSVEERCKTVLTLYVNINSQFDQLIEQCRGI